MKKFFKDFKAFIMRGNVLDMAVAVIIGSAFSAIVTAFTNGIILPIVNFFVAGANDGNGLISVLRAVYKADADGKQVIDLDNSIYIDWGTFIDKVIDFILIALVLFIIIRIFMSLQNLRKDFTSADAKKARKLTKKYMKEEGLGYEAAKKKAEDEIVAEKAASAEPAAPAAPTQEELLAEIRDLLKQNNSSDKN